MQYSLINNEELTEEFIQKTKIRTQKILCPISISFVGIDSNSFNVKDKRVSISPFFEKLLHIKMNSPEDNLKPYKYPLILSKLILITAFLLSSILPLIFMASNNFEVSSLKHTVYYILWMSLIILLFFILGLFHQIKKNRKNFDYYMKLYQKRINKEELRKNIIDSIFFYFYLLILLKNSDQIQNVIISNAIVIAIV